MENKTFEIWGGVYLYEIVWWVEVEEDEWMIETVILNKKGEEMCSISEFADDFDDIEDSWGGQIKKEFIDMTQKLWN